MDIEIICQQLSTDANEEVINQALIGLKERTKTIKDVSQLFYCDGFSKLHKLLKSQDRRYISFVISIFANCTNVCQRWRIKFYEEGGIQIIVDILHSSQDSDLLCRCVRLITNLAKDPTSLKVLQDKFIIHSIINHCPLENTKCQMASLRFLRVICTTKKLAKMAVDITDKFSRLLGLLNSPGPEILQLCLRMISELLKTKAVEVYYRIVENETLNKILVLCKHEENHIEERAFEILFLLALNSGCRVTAASEGALQIFVDRIKTPDQSESFKFATQSLCLCAREAVSRYKMKTIGALPALVKILDEVELVYFHESIVAAFVLFIFDDLSLGLLIRAGVIPAILKYLDRLTTIEFCRYQEHMRIGLSELENAANQTNISEPEVTLEMLAADSTRNEDFTQSEQHQPSWVNSSPETSPYYANSPSYSIPPVSPHISPFYSSPHSPYHSHPSFSPHVSPTYSPPHSPYYASPPRHSNTPYSPHSSPNYSPPHSPYYSQSIQHCNPSFSPHVSPCYSPPHSPSSIIEDDVYSDPLNDSDCSSKPVPYQFQSADGISAMIHGTRGPIHDTLLLLSRFSQANDPSSFFLFLPGFNQLLNYLLLSYNPKPKCARILNRLTLNSHCLDIMLKEKLMPRLYLRLCTGWSLEHLVQLFDDAKSRLKIAQEEEIDSACDDDKHMKDILYQWKCPSDATLSLGRLLISNIRSQCDSSYGKGVLSHIFLTGSKLLKEKVVVSLPHIIRSVRLKRRIFWELKAVHILMEMMSSFPDIGSKMFILNVEAICALSHLVGMTCHTVFDVDRIAHLPVESDKDPTTTEPPAKRRKVVDDTKSDKIDSKVILLKLPSGKIIRCESKYLGKHSRVFERMLSQTYIDSQKPYISISDINENAFLKLVHFLYGCQVRLDVYAECEGVCLYNLKYGDSFIEGKLSDMLKHIPDEPCKASKEHIIKTDSNPHKMVDQNVISMSDDSQDLNAFKIGNALSSADKILAESDPIKTNNCAVKNGTPPDRGNENVQCKYTVFGTELLICSERFFVDDLKVKCENHLMSITSKQNVVDLMLFSMSQNCRLLKQHTFIYLLTSINCPMMRTKYFAEILYSNDRETFLQYMRSEFEGRLGHCEL